MIAEGGVLGRNEFQMRSRLQPVPRNHPLTKSPTQATEAWMGHPAVDLREIGPPAAELTRSLLKLPTVQMLPISENAVRGRLRPSIGADRFSSLSEKQYRLL